MRTAAITISVATLLLAALQVTRADSLWDYQAVDTMGYGTHPAISYPETEPSSKIVVEGVALAGSAEILNPAVMYTAFIQDERSDRGGIQAWTASFFYSPAYWGQLRTTDYVDFAAGDRLRITGLLSDMGRGKAVINNRGHGGAPYLVWHVDVIGHPGLPDPQLIPSVVNCNYFDASRKGGGERYQTRYVMLHGVQISGGTWAPEQTLTVSDATGQVGMLLSGRGDFGQHPKPAGKINVVGIFDQEDDGTAPYTDGYRVWVKRMSDISIALDGCREVQQRSAGERVALVNKVVSRVFDGFFYIQDIERGGGVKVVSPRSVDPGDVICVQGTVTVSDGSKAIEANYIAPGAITPRALAVNSRSLWGLDGLDINGLLVRTVATVGASQGGGIWSLTDDSGQKTIYLRTNGVTMPSQGSIVRVTAVGASFGGAPLLLLAGREDIETVVP